MNALLPPIYLINLDAAHERRHHMQQQLGRLRLPVERVGFDCRTESRARIAALVAARFPGVQFDFQLLSGAEIGCWLSHLEAWRRFLDTPGAGPACAVLEDDVLLAPDLARVLAEAAAQTHYQLVYLGTSSRNLSQRRRRTMGGIALHEPVGSIYNTWGYVLQRDWIARFLAAPPALRLPIDHVLGGRVKAWRPTTAVVQPAAVREEPALGRASQIEPHTWRLDRWRLVEDLRRRLLANRVGQWYAALYRYL